MTQRDRLLAALAESDAYDEAHYDWSDNTPYPQRLIDLLIARGVRVVDVETLAALRELANGNYVGSECIWCMTSFSHNERCPVKRVAAILAALDAEP